METEVLIGLIAAGAVLLLLILGLIFWLGGRQEDKPEQRQAGQPATARGSAAGSGNGRTGLGEEPRETPGSFEPVERFERRDVGDQERREYGERWWRIQAKFVDRPGEALTDAEALLAEVMRQRGYRGPGDLSDGLKRQADAYREADDIADRNRRGHATTEDLRQAMMRYRQVFDALLEREPAGRV